MKKIIYILFGLFAIITFSACSSDSTSSSHSTTQITEQVSTSSNSSSSTTEVSKSSEQTQPSSTTSTEESSSAVQSEPSSQPQPAPQTPDEGGTPQEQDRIVYVARDGTADVYWYSMDNMPANTNKSRVVQMKESDAIAAGKRHTMKEY
ncbi:hypothetical protein HMPREF9176_0898 [Streptococcus downei F0415]|uniref:hypothetical protein n=1 Tax=Streptococcus downei TaxID=1317 RepID=UPI0001E9B17E|nr:hypothetical protein [Streptococcus downei]EFQ57179.1 hypothetical protein HMPREF9176_0898 [Streptococcus downei F0415]